MVAGPFEPSITTFNARPDGPGCAIRTSVTVP
jgi:hypothetical protein